MHYCIGRVRCGGLVFIDKIKENKEGLKKVIWTILGIGFAIWFITSSPCH